MNHENRREFFRDVAISASASAVANVQAADQRQLDSLTTALLAQHVAPRWRTGPNESRGDRDHVLLTAADLGQGAIEDQRGIRLAVRAQPLCENGERIGVIYPESKTDTMRLFT